MAARCFCSKGSWPKERNGNKKATIEWLKGGSKLLFPQSLSNWPVFRQRGRVRPAAIAAPARLRGSAGRGSTAQKAGNFKAKDEKYVR
jgi:hypothetical protein